MEREDDVTDARREYAAAYAAHYTIKDLRGAFERYKGVMVAHPGTPEADYSRSQIENIVKSVIPKQILFDALADLAEGHFEAAGQPD